MSDKYDPLTGELLPQSTAKAAPQSPAKPLTDEQLQDNDFLRSMAKGKLAQIIHQNPATPGLVTAINALLDRIDGKPAQSMTIDQNLNVVTVNAQISFVKPLPLIDGNIIDNEK